MSRISGAESDQSTGGKILFTTFMVKYLTSRFFFSYGKLLSGIWPGAPALVNGYNATTNQEKQGNNTGQIFRQEMNTSVL